MKYLARKFAGVAVFLVVAVFSFAFLLLGTILFLDTDSTPDPAPIEETRDGSILAQEDSLPRTAAERQRANFLLLLPSRTTFSAAARIPADQERELLRTGARFLELWESFPPPQIDSDFSYSDRLRDLTLREFWEDVSSRKDSLDDARICYEDDFSSCQLGQDWAEDGAPGLRVIDYDGRRAYLAGYGTVRYSKRAQWDWRAGQYVYRSYGLLLQKRGGKWLVTRAAAETIESVSR